MRWQNPRLWSLREGWPSYRGVLSAFSATLCAHRLLSVLLGLPSSADTANQLRTADIHEYLPPFSALGAKKLPRKPVRSNTSSP